MEYDAFISYASEDRDAVAHPLACELKAQGVTLWYDQFELMVGDGLRRRIDNGLRSSSYGIVILSAAFFSKEWPQKELDGMAQLEVGGRKVILPVWYNIGVEDIRRYSPTLADRVAVPWNKGLDAVVAAVRLAMSQRPSLPQPQDARLAIELRQDRFLDIPAVSDHLRGLRENDALVDAIDVRKGDLLRQLEAESHQTFANDINKDLGNACLRIVEPWLSRKLSLSPTSVATALHWTCRIARDELLWYLCSRIPLTSSVADLARPVYEQTKWNHTEWHSSRKGMATAARFFEFPTVKGIRFVRSTDTLSGIVVDIGTEQEVHSFESVRDIAEHTLAKFVLPQVSGVRMHRRLPDLSDDGLRQWRPMRDPNYGEGHAAEADS